MSPAPEIREEFALDPAITKQVTGTTFPGYIGFKVLELAPDRVVGTMPIDERHLHPGRYVHGGAWVAFTDSIAGWGTQRNLPHGWYFTTAEMKMNVFREAHEGDTMWAVGRPRHVGKRTQIWEVEVTLNDDEALAGLFLCTQMCLAPEEKPGGETVAKSEGRATEQLKDRFADEIREVAVREHEQAAAGEQSQSEGNADSSRNGGTNTEPKSDD